MTKFDKVVNFLSNLDDDDLIDIHNRVCEESCEMDDYVYTMDMFDEIMGDCSLPSKIADLIYYGDFCPANDYFVWGVYLKSFDYVSSQNCPVYVQDIAKYIVEHDECYGYDELESILNDEDEDDNVNA